MQKKKATSGQQTVIRATIVKRSRTRVPSRSSVSGTWYILSDLRVEGGVVRAQGSRAEGTKVMLALMLNSKLRGGSLRRLLNFGSSCPR